MDQVLDPTVDRTRTVSGTKVKARATAASCRSPHSAAEASAWVENVRVATFHGSRHEGFRRQGARGQVSSGSHGRDRRLRGRHCPGSFGTCQEGSSNSPGRDIDQGLRTISGQSSSTFGGNRCLESHGRWQHRGRLQEIGNSEGPPSESAAASSRQRCRGCRHWWPSCSPNLCRLQVQHQ